MIIWLTGLPCSGKTTIGRVVAARLDAEFLDGDELRNTPFARDIGFTPEARALHLYRVGYLAQRLNRYKDVICAFVSPSEEVRKVLPVDLMIYVQCDEKICELRDVKGMWAKARAGIIKDFTGVNAPYDVPISPHLIVHSDIDSVEKCVEQILFLITHYRNKN